MAQNREAPAFQEYAASMMARADYRVMSLEGRGLFLTMRYECWVNRDLPSDPRLLAKVLGFDVDQVERALAEVKPFFSTEAGKIRCPELDDYRAHINERRERQSAGGRAGAAKTNKGRNSPATCGAPSTPRVSRESLVKQSQIQSSAIKGVDTTPVHDEWVSGYERASKGS